MATMIESGDCFAKILNKRVRVAFKPKGRSWVGLELDFDKSTRSKARPAVIATKPRAKAWVDGLVGKRREVFGQTTW